MMRTCQGIRMVTALWLAGAAIIPSHDAIGQTPPETQRLTCFVLGVPDPIPPTDIITFKGSDAWATVGINRRFGGIAVRLALVNPSVPDAAFDFIEARSAAGAAWQTTIGVADEANDRIVHYNQAAGNSAANWGFESAYQIDADIGISQKEWLPLFSNDYRQPLSFSAPITLTSPCRHTGFQLGEGKVGIVPSFVSIGDTKVLRLTDTYSVRYRYDQNWKWIQVDQAMYIRPAAARSGNLRIYIAQRGSDVIGPIQPFGPIPDALKGKVRAVMGNNEDWFISTLPASYVVLVFNVAGQDIGIALHGPVAQTFTGFLRYRRHAFCRQDRDECGSVQWHTSIAMSRYDRSEKTAFRDGEIKQYTVQYDISSPLNLAAEGFPLSR